MCYIYPGFMQALCPEYKACEGKHQESEDNPNRYFDFTNKIFLVCR